METWSPALATPPPAAPVELLPLAGRLLDGAEEPPVELAAVVPAPPLAVVDAVDAVGAVVGAGEDGAAWTVEVTVTGAVADLELLLPHAARLPATAATMTMSAKRTRAMTNPSF
jgi:hypothetical protein